MRTKSVALAALSAIAIAAAKAEAASPVFYTFNYSSPAGYYPIAALIQDPAGTLYGVTSAGAGAVYALTPPPAGQTLRTVQLLHNFAGAPDGSLPQGKLLRGPQGALFGTTIHGGQSNLGAVYELTPPATPGAPWTEAVLHSFTAAEGDAPVGGLLMDATGALYGAASQGGAVQGCQAYSGCGAVFRLAPPGAGQTAWTETTLYRFTGPTDGLSPAGDFAMDGAGNLYGGASAGPHHNGEIYQLSPPAAGQTAWSKTTLYDFPTVATGYDPNGGLTINPAGALIGTTELGGTGSNLSLCTGGAGCGVVFELVPPAAGQTSWTETIVYNFPGPAVNGVSPRSGVVMDAAGNLYGSTVYGGTCTSSFYGLGTVYKLTPPHIAGHQWKETVPLAATCALGSEPNGPPLLGTDHVLYDTAQTGGQSNAGTAFRFRY